MVLRAERCTDGLLSGEPSLNAMEELGSPSVAQAPASLAWEPASSLLELSWVPPRYRQLSSFWAEPQRVRFAVRRGADRSRSLSYWQACPFARQMHAGNSRPRPNRCSTTDSLLCYRMHQLIPQLNSARHRAHPGCDKS